MGSEGKFLFASALALLDDWLVIMCNYNILRLWDLQNENSHPIELAHQDAKGSGIGHVLESLKIQHQTNAET